MAQYSTRRFHNHLNPLCAGVIVEGSAGSDRSADTVAGIRRLNERLLSDDVSVNQRKIHIQFPAGQHRAVLGVNHLWTAKRWRGRGWRISG